MIYLDSILALGLVWALQALIVYLVSPLLTKRGDKEP